MDKLNLSKESLKKFGITMGVAFLVITLIILVRHRHSILPTTAIAGLFFALALIAPLALKPIYILWMRLAFVLGWFNTKLILFILYYLVFFPVGILMRLSGKDLLDQKIEKSKDSYWKKKEEKLFNPADYERQF